MRSNSEIQVMVVDDKRGSREALEKMIAKEDYRVSFAHDAETALEIFETEPAHLVITDLKMPGMDGISLLKELKRKSPETEVILISGHGTVETAVEAMREGAYDFITKPLERVVVLKAISKAREKQDLIRENADLRAKLQNLTDSHGIIGNSAAIHEVKELIRQVAPTSANVLILGESGTGKELVANAIHKSSEQVEGPFIKVNCAALPENLLESELFGYERGAFTGAVSRKEGRFFLADKGMLFLDEIGDMPMPLQAKILRVLQEGEFERLGGNETIKVDVRIVAATNQDLALAIAERRFREDLYYRLNVISINLPLLRDRRSDIPLLVEHFIQRFSAKNNQQVSGFSRDAVEAMTNYDWPGNIRELENTVERAIVLGRSEVLTLDDLPPAITKGGVSDETEAVEAGVPIISIPVGTPLAEVEHRVILETLRSTGGDKSAAARRLGIATRTIYRKLDQAEQLKN
ncbi:MAG: sigma-54-dependent Fis family transcriptional regulator [Nitrospinaceae bacterium]|jgi:two-component system, NtrC family, response regulator HydG|nr:sigma-54-dependent Fis family transcriptional regulator [Nitrospinaceae bacterium]MBT4432656.1 sigma-54-dependent Fis family transcriptional regulator [Nitrospinaceae bacterium]MBT5369907.1 sigma-54-dependent Fis family transcriptional regulator [Nitrospinaceae bacterium]MBT5948687.1 sigma-54-dependent Fis family transcriptional regulator [Nitrospinaceae bacterium]MBT6394014.1 sigma-54-dependent Fis family transcriptional regulator [Nitrospinaceae bacterium]